MVSQKWPEESRLDGRGHTAQQECPGDTGRQMDRCCPLWSVSYPEALGGQRSYGRAGVSGMGIVLQ